MSSYAVIIYKCSFHPSNLHQHSLRGHYNLSYVGLLFNREMRFPSVLSSCLGFVAAVHASGVLGGSQSSCSSGNGWTYKGCYSDVDNGEHVGYTWQLSSNQRSIYYYPSYNGIITIDFCQQACRGHGFRYAALHNTTDCFCGASLPSATPKRSAKDNVAARRGKAPGTITAARRCHIPGQGCAGNPAQFCGSSQATDVYEDPSFSKSSSAGAAANFKYLGCFYNEQPGLLQVEIEMAAADDCAKYCGDRGYPFMGRGGYDREADTSPCGCGTEIQKGSQVADGFCNYLCNGSAHAT